MRPLEVFDTADPEEPADPAAVTTAAAPSATVGTTYQIHVASDA
jgi:hypothetical protein